MSFSCLINHVPHSVSPVPAMFVLMKSGFDSVKTVCLCLCVHVNVRVYWTVGMCSPYTTKRCLCFKTCVILL